MLGKPQTKKKKRGGAGKGEEIIQKNKHKNCLIQIPQNGNSLEQLGGRWAEKRSVITSGRSLGWVCFQLPREKVAALPSPPQPGQEMGTLLLVWIHSSIPLCFMCHLTKCWSPRPFGSQSGAVQRGPGSPKAGTRWGLRTTSHTAATACARQSQPTPSSSEAQGSSHHTGNAKYSTDPGLSSSRGKGDSPRMPRGNKHRTRNYPYSHLYDSSSFWGLALAVECRATRKSKWYWIIWALDCALRGLWRLCQQLAGDTAHCHWVFSTERWANPNFDNLQGALFSISLALTGRDLGEKDLKPLIKKKTRITFSSNSRVKKPVFHWSWSCTVLLTLVKRGHSCLK